MPSSACATPYIYTLSLHDALPILPACDAYLLMDVIHDWGDEETLAILCAIRRAAAVQARLLLIEWLLADDPGPQWTKTIDVHMLADRKSTRLNSSHGYISYAVFCLRHPLHLHSFPTRRSSDLAGLRCLPPDGCDP